MPADHRYHPVGDHGQEHRRHHERQHGFRRGVVGRSEAHHAAGGGARGDQGTLAPGRLARPGQAERQQREDRHPDIQRQRLDPARGALVLGVEHVPVLSIQADREQADAEQEQQPCCDGDQDAARPAATPPSPGQGRANIVLAVHRAKDRAGPLPVRAVRGGSRYGVNHGTDSVRLCQAAGRCLFRQVVAPAGGRLMVGRSAHLGAACRGRLPCGPASGAVDAAWITGRSATSREVCGRPSRG